MADKRLQQLKINSIDVSNKVINWKLKKNFGDPIDELTLKFPITINDVVTLSAGLSVELWFGYTTSTDKKYFKGEIISFEPDGAVMKIKAYNELHAAVRKTINAKIYDKNVVGDAINPDGKVSDAFTDLITTYAGLNADATSVEDSGTAITLDILPCDQVDVKDKLNVCSELLDWAYYYRADTDLVYFHPKQFNVNSLTLTVGSNVIGVPKWKYDKSNLINDLRIDGVFQQEPMEELFSGDGVTDSFTLSATPVGGIIVYINASKNYSTASPAQNETQTLGVENATSGSYDYTVNKSTKKIVFESGSIPAVGTNSILVRYVGKKEVPVHAQDDVSIAENKLHQRTIQLKDVITVADAEARANKILERFKEPFQSTTLKVRHKDGNSFELGDQISVVDSVNKPNVNGDFTVWEIVYNYPAGFDEISVGDRELDPPEFFMNTSERLHRLERELISEGTVLTEVRGTSMDLELSPDSLSITEEYINDSFILDHTVNSILHASTDALIVDDFETTGNWIQGTGSETLTIAANSTAGQFWVGSQGVKVSWVAISGIGVLQNTSISVDLSSALGIANGTPLQGTIGVWVHMTQGTDISELRLRIGSSSVNYAEYIGQTYKKKVAGFEAGFIIEDTVQTLILFDMNSVDASSGTPDWTSVAFVQLRFTIAGAGDLTFDYLTCSEDNNISLNGLGDRTTTKVVSSYSY